MEGLGDLGGLAGSDIHSNPTKTLLPDPSSALPSHPNSTKLPLTPQIFPRLVLPAFASVGSLTKVSQDGEEGGGSGGWGFLGVLAGLVELVVLWGGWWGMGEVAGSRGLSRSYF